MLDSNKSYPGILELERRERVGERGEERREGRGEERRERRGEERRGGERRREK